MYPFYIQKISIVLVFNSFFLGIYSFDYQHFNEWITESSQCAGKRQSPVKINRDDVKTQLEQTNLKFSGYNQVPKTMTMQNNGHTVQLTAKWSHERPIISGGPLRGQYFLDSLHFHWGISNSKGSEHTISNQSFPLEMHLIHVNTNYKSLSDAENQNDGLSVIGILFNIDTNVGDTLAPFISSINKLKSINAKITVPPFSLSIFGLSEEKEFYTYLGSLTTPPCLETVTWLIATTTRKVTDSQMQIFRKVSLAHGDKINWRPTQPLNGRVVKMVKGA